MRKILDRKIVYIAWLLIPSIVTMLVITVVYMSAFAKGLRIYLITDSNQRPQEGKIYTYQHG
ncbi:MAG: hypothetical protein WBX01_17945 [Nitrososphaeraceae archaeon]